MSYSLRLHSTRLIVAIAAALVAASSLLGEQLLNIDFGPHLATGFVVKTGPAAVGFSEADFWNVYSRDVSGPFDWRDDGEEYDLLWSDASPSAIDIAVRNAGGAWGFPTDDPMLQSYLYPQSHSGNVLVDLSQLPQGVYDVYFYAHGALDGENGVIGLVASGVDYGIKTTSTSPGWNLGGWQEGLVHVVFRDVAIDAGGLMELTVQPGATGLAVISGMQLVRREALPPPSLAFLNVDFTAHLAEGYIPKSGPAAVGESTDDYWNVYSRDVSSAWDWRSDGVEQNLMWANGSVSPVDIAVTNASGAYGTGSPDPMFNTYLYPGGGGNVVVSLTEVPIGIYDLYVYAHGGDNSQNVVVGLSVGGEPLGQAATGVGPGWNDGVLLEGTDYVVFRGLPVALGESVVITASPGASVYACINGLQLVRWDSQAPQLAINPPGGLFTNSVSVVLSTPVQQAEILYTLDSSDPTAGGAVYTEPLLLTQSTTVKAVLFINGFPASEVVSADFTCYQRDDIEFLPPSGLFTNQVTVTLANTVAAGQIHYTVDGGAPTPASPLYTSPIHLTISTTVRARLYFNGFAISEVFQASYDRVYCSPDDGVPFGWRELHFGAGFLTNPDAAADADPDGDGYTNLEEFGVGTIPTDADSAPAISLSIRAVPKITFDTLAGKAYQILRRPFVDSTEGEEVIETLTATTNTAIFVDEDAPSPAFYSIRLAP